jgi:hypothetical protein
MKKIFFCLFFFALSLSLAAQNELGFRIGVLQNKLHDCYSGRGDQWQDLAPGAYTFFAWKMKSHWYLQTELGFSFRNTHIGYSGVSHHFSYDYRLQQMEINVLGKFDLFVDRPRLTWLAGISAGILLGGREHEVGYAVGNYSVNIYRETSLKHFLLHRFQFGPMFGLEIAQPLGNNGGVVFDTRMAFYPEKDLHNCSLPHEMRLSFSLGYLWNIRKRVSSPRPG